MKKSKQEWLIIHKAQKIKPLLKNMKKYFSVLFLSILGWQCEAQEFTVSLGAIYSQGKVEKSIGQIFNGRDPTTGLPIAEEAHRTLAYKINWGFTAGVNMDWHLTKKLKLNTGIELTKEIHSRKDESDSSPMSNENNRSTFFPELDSSIELGYGKNIFFRETEVLFLELPFRSKIRFGNSTSLTIGANIRTPLFHQVKSSYWEIQTDSDIGPIASRLVLDGYIDNPDQLLNELFIIPNTELSFQFKSIGLSVGIYKIISDLFKTTIETRPMQYRFKIFYHFTK